MKTIILLATAVIAGAVRYPAEGPIPVRDEAEADRLIDLKLARDADDDADFESDDLSNEKVDDLKKIAAEEGVDLGESTKKADIIAAIRAARNKEA